MNTQRMNSNIDPELMRLQRLIAALLVLFTLLLLAVVSVSDVLLRSWYDDVANVRRSEQRIVLAATIGLDVDTLAFEAAGVRSADAGALARLRLAYVVKQLEETRHVLMSTATSASMTEMLPIMELVGDNMTLSPANQWTATVDLATRADMLRQYPPEVFNHTAGLVGSLRAVALEMRASAAYVEHNLLTVIIPALRQSSSAYDQEANDSMAFVEIILVVVTGVAMVPLILSVVFAYGPAMVRNEGEGSELRAHLGCWVV